MNAHLGHLDMTCVVVVAAYAELICQNLCVQRFLLQGVTPAGIYQNVPFSHKVKISFVVLYRLKMNITHGFKECSLLRKTSLQINFVLI